MSQAKQPFIDDRFVHQTLTAFLSEPDANMHLLYVLAHGQDVPSALQPELPRLARFGMDKDKAGVTLIDDTHRIIAVVVLPAEDDAEYIWGLAAAAKQLPKGQYHLASYPADATHIDAVVAGWALAQYQCVISQSKAEADRQLCIADEALLQAARGRASAIVWVREMINQPPNIMHPEGIAACAQDLAKQYDGQYEEIIGDTLLEQNYPLIHAVGRAAQAPHQQPRLIRVHWGNPEHPRIAIIGKGVSFDSGGLDIKPPSGMRLMKKDMGGAAHAIGLAKLVMQAKLPVCLELLIPSVENAISGDAYRPSDVIPSRLGKTIEIDNTDAEGRLILADAMADAAEKQPELMIDFATLTGAARVAMGTAVPAFFTRNEAIMTQIMRGSQQCHDWLWPLPLYKPYISDLSSHIADIKNSGGSYGGAITAALFLSEFVPESIDWVHIDVMAWNLGSKPGRPEGGEAMGMMAMMNYLCGRYQ